MKQLINYYTCKIFGFFIFMCLSSTYAQDKEDHFVFFGYNPEVVNRQLYKSLNNAIEPRERIVVLDSIATQFIQSKNADSLFHYGSMLKDEVLNLKLKGLKGNQGFKSKYQLKSLFYKGLGSQSMGLLDESARYFIEGIRLSEEKSEEKKRLIFPYFKLALAETYILRKETLKAASILGEVAPICNTLTTLLYYKIARSNYYLLNNELENAEKLIKNTLQTLNKEKYQRIYIRFQIALGRLKLLEGKLNESLGIFTKIKDKAINAGYYDLYIAIILNQGEIYSVSKNYQVAEIILSTAYVNAVQWNQLNLQQKIVKALVRVYISKDNYKNAYNLKTQLEGINRRIILGQNKRFIRDLEFKYETLKKEKKIHILQEDQVHNRTEIEYQKTVKYGILIAFLIILIPIILLLVVYYQKLQTQSLLGKQQEILRQKEMTSVLQTQELALVKNTIVVQNKERDRIARELHDSIGGNISGIKLQMTNLVARNPEVGSLLIQLEKTYQHVRDISHSLIPDEFKENNFTYLIKNYITSLEQNNSVVINFDAYPENAVNTLNYTLQSNLFNIIKELITNAFKHAKATEIALQLIVIEQDNSIEFLYEDDGVGFDIKKTSKGIGILNIEHRVKAFNGLFSIDSALNRGTVITISIPQQN
ncbi:tetratricopeptide repeat-containing sensor histidine kinase [Tenacibaculum finnmarkense]|uniref:tetratricopeptide repeat-containing sensor histidine kinase n=1 Tax=Tenacibaculum finnmarkense TaxID=2781243 RepID=UPI001E53882E|nr:ATP-binding protein [Tenacibaculum finnmarkense]MCD8411789.1 histidine kinase [Tenacibaculum finnmarkense genomovar ulcerans]